MEASGFFMRSLSSTIASEKVLRRVPTSNQKKKGKKKKLKLKKSVYEKVLRRVPVEPLLSNRRQSFVSKAGSKAGSKGASKRMLTYADVC